ncbi:MAG TPA: hypothetical protein VFG98_05460, partial [Intrasporangium sp.]|nr:hypothetical protein [Intrasporangium sp.]
LVDVEVRTTSFVQRYATSDELWERLLGGTVRMRALVHAQRAEVQSEIQAAFIRRVLPYATGLGLELPVSAKIAVGLKPGRDSSEG